MATTRNQRKRKASVSGDETLFEEATRTRIEMPVSRRLTSRGDGCPDCAEGATQDAPPLSSAPNPLVPTHNYTVNIQTGGGSINVTSGTVGIGVRDSPKLDLLKELRPVEGALHDARFSNSGPIRRSCTPGTRREILREILCWAQNPWKRQIYWLNGMAGTGKTTIAYSLCEELKALGLLGAAFFCSRNTTDCSSAENIPPSVAYQLAQVSSPFLEALVASLASHNGQLGQNISVRFERTLEQPLKKVSNLNLVVVIDALDECSEPIMAKEFVSNIWKYANSLPIKFFFTSRPEPHFHDMLYSLGDISAQRFHLHDIETAMVDADIRLFIQEQLGQFEDESEKWGSLLEELVNYSGRLFICAATTTKFILQGSFGYRAERLERIISRLPSATATSSIDGLYEGVLDAVFKYHGEENEVIALSNILQAIVCVRDPLSIRDLACFIGIDERKINGLLSGLHSVLLIPQGCGPIQPLHASFPDYLARARFLEKRCGMTPSAIHAVFTRSSFQIMVEQLRFNITNSFSSYQANSETPLSTFLNSIGTRLAYASRFWGHHLQQAQAKHLLLPTTLVEQFAKEKILFWLEVLSALQAVSTASSSLETLISFGCSTVNSLTISKETALILTDTIKFVQYFAQAVARSAPHLYISALPFAPTCSILAQLYCPKIAHAVRLRFGLLKFWPATQKVLSVALKEVSSIAFSPNGKSLASGLNDSMVRIWDVETGELVRFLFEEPVLDSPLEEPVGFSFEDPQAVHSVTFSANGKRLASGSEDGMIRIWDAETGELVGSPFQGHTSRISSVSFSPDGKRLASGSWDGTVCIWAAETGEPMGSLSTTGTAAVESVAFSHDGERLVVGSEDGMICIWDTDTGKQVRLPLQRRTSICSVSFSSDGKRLVSSSGDGAIRVWNVETGRPIELLFANYTGCQINSVVFSPDGKRLASGSANGEIHFWDAKTGNPMGSPLEGHTRGVASVQFSPDEKRLASGSYDGTIRIWDAKLNETAIPSFPAHTGVIDSLAFSPDGKKLASGSREGTVHVWNAETGDPVGLPLLGDMGWVRSVAFSPGGKVLVLYWDSRVIQIWDSETERLVESDFQDCTKLNAGGVMFSPDGKRLASGSEDGMIRIWDTETGRLVRSPFRGHTGTVWGISFSPDGKRLASCSYQDGTICIWDAQTGEPLGVPIQTEPGISRSVALSSGGKRLASGSELGMLCIWDAETGELVVSPFQGHEERIWAVSFSPDGNNLASSSDDRTVCIWNVETGEQVGPPLQGHVEGVHSIAFSPDGKRLASGSGDNTIRIWNMKTRELADWQRDPALLSGWPEYDELSSQVHIDGWIIGPQGELLLWIPPAHRAGLRWPDIITVIGGHPTCLDFSNWRCGSEWAQCYIAP